jgi:hypothetical protein
VAARRVSKSASLLLRYRSSGGTQISVSRLRIGVALYAPASIRYLSVGLGLGLYTS